mmetsp:Transcript_24193/g.20325  ORF Transcript_24193/g.20325 Transcript_24193/m.20325 type:complete len:91 (+) Transcript_24193:73-345(+)
MCGKLLYQKLRLENLFRMIKTKGFSVEFQESEANFLVQINMEGKEFFKTHDIKQFNFPGESDPFAEKLCTDLVNCVNGVVDYEQFGADDI